MQELKATTERQAAVIALQEGQIKALTAGLSANQKVSAQLEASKPRRKWSIIPKAAPSSTSPHLQSPSHFTVWQVLVSGYAHGSFEMASVFERSIVARFI